MSAGIFEGDDDDDDDDELITWANKFCIRRRRRFSSRFGVDDKGDCGSLFAFLPNLTSLIC